MPIYRGVRTHGGCTVTVDGESLDPRLDLVDHSPTGFNWSYGGSGPAQLALAVLADYLGDGAALELYQTFKWQVIAGLKADEWTFDAPFIEGWLDHCAATSGWAFDTFFVEGNLDHHTAAPGDSQLPRPKGRGLRETEPST